MKLEAPPADSVVVFEVIYYGVGLQRKRTALPLVLPEISDVL